jgi:hypothetical protein
MAIDDDDMPEKPEAHDAWRTLDLGSCPVVGLARLGIPTRVVVGDRVGPSIVAEHRVEDLADWDERAVDRSLGDDDGLPEPICGVAHEYEDALAAQAIQLPACDFSHIGWATQHKRHFVETEPSAQLKRCHKCRRLGDSNATPGGELLGPCGCECAEAAVFSEQWGCETQRALPWATMPQDERKQLAVAQSIWAGALQTLSRTLAKR